MSFLQGRFVVGRRAVLVLSPTVSAARAAAQMPRTACQEWRRRPDERSFAELGGRRFPKRGGCSTPPDGRAHSLAAAVSPAAARPQGDHGCRADIDSMRIPHSGAAPRGYSRISLDFTRATEPRMKLLIGNKNYSSWSMRPWVMLTQFDIPFEEVMARFDSFARRLHASRRRWRRCRPPARCRSWSTTTASPSGTRWRSPSTWPRSSRDKALWPRDARRRARARSVCAEMHSGFGALRSVFGMNIEASLPEVGARVLAENAAARADLARVIAALAGGARRVRRPVPVRRLFHRRRLLRAGGDAPAHLRAAGAGRRRRLHGARRSPPRARPRGSATRWRRRNSCRSRRPTARRATD